jgi:hypothetical protein
MSYDLFNSFPEPLKPFLFPFGFLTVRRAVPFVTCSYHKAMDPGQKP